MTHTGTIEPKLGHVRHLCSQKGMCLRLVAKELLPVELLHKARLLARAAACIHARTLACGRCLPWLLLGSNLFLRERQCLRCSQSKLTAARIFSWSEASRLCGRE